MQLTSFLSTAATLFTFTNAASNSSLRRQICAESNRLRYCSYCRHYGGNDGRGSMAYNVCNYLIFGCESGCHTHIMAGTYPVKQCPDGCQRTEPVTWDAYKDNFYMEVELKESISFIDRYDITNLRIEPEEELENLLGYCVCQAKSEEKKPHSGTALFMLTVIGLVCSFVAVLGIRKLERTKILKNRRRSSVKVRPDESKEILV